MKRLNLIFPFLLIIALPGHANAGIFSHWFNQCSSLGAKNVNIHTVQGIGDTSPLLGQDVEVQGIITAVAPELKGFFIQAQADDMDANPKTSEGLFVYSQIMPELEKGHVVKVRGVVQEHFGMTQINAIGVSEPCGQAVIPTVAISLPLAEDFDWESIEGMYVMINEPSVVVNSYNYTRYNELTISNKILVQPTEILSPYSVEAKTLKALNSRSKVLIDDLANGAPSMQRLLFPITAENSLRIGSTINTISGVVDFSFEQYRIRTTESLQVSRAARPEVPKIDAPIKLAAFNVLNLFNGDGTREGFPTKRGADTFEEYTVQLEKIVSTILLLDAQVIGLNEIENDGFDSESSIAQLVDALNSKAGKYRYAYIGQGQSIVGSDSISVGIIYQPQIVTPVGALKVLTTENSPFDAKGPLFDSQRNRPSFTQLFKDNKTNQTFVVNVNHLKSKGSSCGSGDDSELQANCNGTRTRAAQGLSQWLSKTYPDQPVFIVGDLNSYAKEDPIKAFETAGFINTVAQFNEQTYTYSFRGEIGSLDYVLANQQAQPFVVDAQVWNSNAAEPIAIDYNQKLLRSDKQKPEDFRNTGPYRASDHDVVIVGLSF